jgi:hypothetical protein
VVAFVTSVLIAAALLLLLIPFSKRRPPGTPLTWGEAMVAAVYSFFLMFWVYAMIPHLWLTWTSNELGWRPDKLLTGPGGILKTQKEGGWFPLTLNYQTIRDIVAVIIYVVALGAQMAIFAWWQNRAKKAEEVPAITTSDFGRPLVRKS